MYSIILRKQSTSLQILQLNLKIKKYHNLYSKSVKDMFWILKIISLELDNMGTPFLLLKLAFINSQIFSFRFIREMSQSSLT